jgi:hypothetical protein
MIDKLNYVFLGMLILPLAVFAQGFKVQTGTNVVVSSAAKIVLSENASFENAGNFTHGNGEVIFSGNVDQEIAGTSTSTFYDLDINKSAGDLLAAADFNVDNELKMTSGQLDLQNATVDLGTSGSIVNETETNRIKVGNITTNTGTIQATRTINSVTDFNPGNLGVLISTNVNMGSITVVRGHQVQQGSGSFTGNYSVARYYEVPNIGQLDANDQVKLHYWDAELNGHTEANLEIYQWVEEGSAPAWWTPLLSSVNAGSNLVSPGAVPYSDYFDPPNWYPFNFTEVFTLGSKDNPLPVELTRFEGTCHGEFAILQWETASEQNNEMFFVERSIDGEIFNVIGAIDGAGDSNQPLAYEFYDTKPLPKAYYRLKQVDFDGAFEYSNIINLSCNDVPDPMFTVYPNPFKSELHVMVSDLPEYAFLLELYTIEGKQIMQEKLFAPSEGLHKILQLDNLVPAMYVIRVISGDFVKSYRIEKQ